MNVINCPRIVLHVADAQIMQCLTLILRYCFIF